MINDGTVDLLDTDRLNAAQFASSFEYVCVGMALYTPEGKFLYANKSLIEILGYSLNELQEISFADIIHPDDINAGLEAYGLLLNGRLENFRQEKKYITKSGDHVWINLNVSRVLNQKGVHIYTIAQMENIHERKLTELALKNEKDRLSNVIKANRVGTWEWNVQTGETIFNQYWAETLGYQLSELKPLNIQTWQNLVHPDDLVQTLKIIQSCFDQNENSYKCQCRMKHKDGHWVWILGSGEILDRTADGKPLNIFGINTDITEIKNSHLNLLQNQAFLETVLNTIHVGVVACDADGILTLFNRATKEFHGLPDEPIPAEEWAEHYNLFHSDGVTPLKKEEVPLFQVLDKGYITNTEISIKPKNGPLRIVSGSGGLIKDKSGVVHGAVVAMQDITAQKKYEASLEKLNAALETTNRDLERFAYVASHDLQEPLRMITGFLGLLESKFEKVMDEKAKQYIHYSVDGAKRMNQMILDILEFSKAGKFEDGEEMVDLNIVVNEVVALFKKQADQVGAKINIGQLPTFSTFKNPLRQVFQNLISNALKYHKKGQEVRIDISAHELAEYWEFRVCDNGIGIDEKYFKKIFSIFERVHTKREYAGTGIGLSIVERIIDTLGGKIRVESKINEGATFIFTVKKKNPLHLHVII